MFRFIKALEGRDSALIHREARKEAKRQVTSMTKWLDLQEKTNAEAVETIYAPLVAPIRKAQSYQTKIYNESKKVKPLEEKVALAQARGETDEVLKLWDKLAEVDALQWSLCWKILKIYCYVDTAVVLEQGVDPNVYHYEQREMNYPEESE